MRAALLVPPRLTKVSHAADGSAASFGFSSFSHAFLWSAAAAIALQSTLTHAHAATRSVAPESQETQSSTTEVLSLCVLVKVYLNII